MRTISSPIASRARFRSQRCRPSIARRSWRWRWTTHASTQRRCPLARRCPIRWPRDLPAAIGLSLGVVLIALIQVRTSRYRGAPKDHRACGALGRRHRSVSRGRQEARRRRQESGSAGGPAGVQPARRRSGAEAARSHRSLSSAARDRVAADGKSSARRQVARGRAEASGVGLEEERASSQPLAEALEKNDLEKAEQQMRELAKRLRDKPDAQAKAAARATCAMR